MNKEITNEKFMTMNTKANLYMAMGVLLEVITFLWSINIIIPKAVFVIAGILGLVPIIIINKFKGECASEREIILWYKAKVSTMSQQLAVLVFYWIFTCISRVVTMPITADVCYMIPYLIGFGYLFTGYKFKVYIKFDDEEE